MAYLGDKKILFSTEITGLVNIDTEISDESENPVQNKVIKNYVDSQKVIPPKMSLDDTEWAEQTEELTDYIDDGYYNDNSAVGKHIIKVSHATTNCFHVLVNAGEKYKYFADANITTGNIPLWFCFADKDGNSSVQYNQVKNYITATDETNVYAITIPENTKHLYLTISKAKKDIAYLKSTFKYYSIDWLKLKEHNFDNEIIPLTALQKEVKYLYSSSIAKPLNFGNKIVAFGDSITAGVTSPNLSITANGYIKLFADSISATLVNNAASGTCITAIEGDNNVSIGYKVAKYTGTADTIIVAGGINDYYTGKPLGTYDSTDTKTFYGALRVMCSALSTNCANATIIFITPINTTRKAPNSVEPLNSYRNAIFEIATEYGFNVVDGSKIGFPIGSGNYQNIMITDGVHPTELGHKFYANSLKGILL